MVFSLKRIGLELGMVVSYCKKIGLMLLLGCVIKSNGSCGRPIHILLIPGPYKVQKLFWGLLM